MTLPFKFNADGLMPVIVQDAETNEVLMMAWTNEEAYNLMLKTGRTYFWSRSRNKLWMKGEESGHVQDIVSIQTDCDADTLLVRVKQTGNACHLERPSCFGEPLYGDIEKHDKTW
jgi:phosphoribosyl-ATP pyrophosphohydrolase/phosphoribosyl-AMP cyclohydrolase